jgi:signal transduction histidine kinase
LPTTLRIALLAGLLALVSNLSVIGFIRWRTHDEAITTLRHEVVEQGAVLADVYHTGGMPALKDAINDAVSLSDEQIAVGLFDSAGHKMIGNLAGLPHSNQPLQEGYRSALLRFEERTAPQEAALFVHRLPNGLWLISGRGSGEGLAFRETLERSLLIAVVLALLLGLACGLILAKYVDARVRRIVAVTDRISARDLSQRVPVSRGGDAFDRLGQRINDMLDRISRLMEELRLLTDSLAHDLRSPVSRLRAAADAASATSDPDERDQQLASVIRQADSLMRILTTILEISRSEALTGRNQFTQFDAGELGAELSEMYEPVAEETGVVVRFDRAPGPLPLFGHRQLIAQAISNLIENAIRYAASGREIEVAVADDGKTLRIEVADRGPGIPGERRGEALRRFGRLDSSRSAAGAGLGLALVSAIAHLHYGELILEDNAPGLRAVLWLPIGSPAAPAPPADPSADRSGNSRA